MSPEKTVLVGGIGLVLVLLLGRAVWSGISAARSERRHLEQAGYIACPEETEYLERLAGSLRDHPGVEVRHPYRYKTRDVTIYRYDVHAGNYDHGVVAEEFLFPLKRHSRAPCALFVLPARLDQGLTRKILQTILGKTETLAPPGAEQIEVPPPLRSRILTALGPPGAALYDLVDERLLSDLLHGASKGFVAIRAVDDYCTMEVLSAYGRKLLPRFDWPVAAAAVRELAERQSALGAPRFRA